MGKYQLALALGLAALSSTALAQRDSERENRFEQLDVDGNGNLSFEEFQQGDAGMFGRLDSNGDALLSLEEFTSARPPRGPRPEGRNEDREEDRENGRNIDPERLEHMRARMEGRATEAFNEMDANGDGLLSLVEFQEATFLRLDRDGNGVLTARELRPPRQRGEHGFGGPRGGRGPGGQGQSNNP